jgi:MATE family multidrug resistance protein
LTGLPDAEAVAPTRGRITYARVAAIALPVVLSNATVPLQGAIDTAIIGNLGDAVYLAAVTLGAQVITLLLAVFNFLQFGAGALSAQALGAGDRRRVINVLARALIIAAGIGLLLIAAQALILPAAMAIFEASPRAERLAGVYFSIRIWAAPAELGAYAVTGWFAGQEMTRRLFEVQVVTSVSNILLNLVFVIGLGMDVDGVALGTLIAAWLGLGFGLWRVRQRMAALMPEWRPERRRLLDPGELGRLMRLNRDIFIRTILLVSSFTWFTRLGSLQGDVVLAANGILYQIFHVAVYALDGFAIAVESLVGQAAGARDRALLRRSAVVSTVAAIWLAVGFALLLFAIEEPLIRLFTNVPEVRAAADAFFFWAALMPLAGVLAYQLDGIFMGATEGPAMRNAMIVAAGLYLALSASAAEAFGNHGVWAGIWAFLTLRALTLAVQYPALERRAAR